MGESFCTMEAKGHNGTKGCNVVKYRKVVTGEIQGEDLGRVDTIKVCRVQS